MEGFNNRSFDKIDTSNSTRNDAVHLLPANGERPSPTQQSDAHSTDAAAAAQKSLPSIELVDPSTELYPPPKVGYPKGLVPGAPFQPRDLRAPSNSTEAEQFELQGITNTVENGNHAGYLLYEAKQYLIGHDQEPLRWSRLEQALSKGGMSRADIERLESTVRQRDPNEHTAGHRDIPGTRPGIL